MASDPGLVYYCYHCERSVQLASPDTLLCAECHGDFIEERPDASPAPEGLPSSSHFTFNEIDYMGPRFGQLLEDMSSFLTQMQVTAHGLDPINEDAPHILRLGTDAHALNPILLLQGRIQNLLNLRGGEYGVDSGGPLRLPGTIGDYFVGPGLEHLIQQLAENDPNKYGTPPASKSAIDALPSISISTEHLGSDASQCAVCKDDFELGSQVKLLPCNHMYHPNCIFPWLEQHNSCPVCRFELPTDDPDYERSRAQVSGGGDYAGTTSADGSHEEQRARNSFAFQSLPGQSVTARYPTESNNASEQEDILLGVQAPGTVEGGINIASNEGASIGRRLSMLAPWLRGASTLSQSDAVTQAENFSYDSNANGAGNDRNARQEQIILRLLASADNDGDTITRAENLSFGSNANGAGNDRNAHQVQIILRLLASANNDGDTHLSETREEEVN